MSVVSSVDYRKLVYLIMSLAAAFFVLSATRSTASAAESRTIVIPADDGYGLQDCLAKGAPCGRIVADAWCEAHGMSASVAYGPADDVTGALADKVSLSKTPRIEPGSYIVTCGE